MFEQVAKALKEAGSVAVLAHISEDADALGAEVAEMFSDLDVEVQYGGQPLYYYLISAE